MSDPWLSIIGIGEDGLPGLSRQSQEVLDAAEVIFGGPRHLELGNAGNRGQAWAVPFSIEPVLALKSRKVAMLVSGDPFCFGAGSSVTAHLTCDDWVAYPAPSTFSLACSRLGWRLEKTHTFGLHATPFSHLRPVLSDGVQIICLMRDGMAPSELAQWLDAQGFGETIMTILEALGGPREKLRVQKASNYALTDVTAPVAVALQLRGRGMSRASGLPDDAFHSDGQITKRPVRAMTLSALAPRDGEILWDLGAGSGSISVEWCLSAPDCKAFAVERQAKRVANITRNIADFGLEQRMQVHQGTTLELMATLPDPNVVFIGGGATAEVLDQLWDRLPLGARLVVNSVTLETEALLINRHQEHGGQLMRLAISEVGPLGSMRGWESARPVVQWSVTR